MIEKSPDNPDSVTASQARRLSLWRRLLRCATSVPVLTIFMLVAVDLVLRQGNFLDAMGFHTVDVWNVPPRLELCRETDPDVALIGSSLLLVLNQDEQGSHFYSGVYPPHFQEQLRRAAGQPVTCINLCSGLQMPSEAYLIAEAVLSRKEHPQVLIYGIALRDFIHDQYAREWSCDSFASIAPYVPLSPAVLSAMTSPSAIKEFTLSHLWYLYRNRTDFKNAMSAFAKDWLEYLPLDMPYIRLSLDHQWRPQRSGFLFETWVPRQQEKFTEAIFRSRPEFLKRYFMSMQGDIYRQGTEGTMKIQTHYLNRLIELCRQRGVHLVLVNMPLSPELAPLVPPGLYDAFRQFLGYIASESRVPVVDFYQDPDFDAGDFKDGVHLNYPGALRMADKLVARLKEKYPAVVEAMAEHAAERQQSPDREKDEVPYRRL